MLHIKIEHCMHMACITESKLMVRYTNEHPEDEFKIYIPRHAGIDH